MPGYLAHTWNSAIKSLRYTDYTRDPVATHVYKFKVSWASRKIMGNPDATITYKDRCEVL
jgi:hypothetical protein